MDKLIRVDICNDYQEHIQNVKKHTDLYNQAGVYLIFDKNKEIVYIGGSLNLKNRISYHPVIKEHFKDISFVVCIYTDNKTNFWLECYIRNYFRPKYCKELDTHINRDRYGRNLYLHKIYKENTVNRVSEHYKEYIRIKQSNNK